MRQDRKRENTQWIVITGAPSSGKTSVIEELARRGFPVQPEVARELIDSLLSKGETLEEIRGKDHVRQLQRKILAMQLARERHLNPGQIVFLDRGLGDSVAYFRQAGLNPLRVMATARRRRYRAVFIFDRLPVQRDEARTETDEEAARIGKMIEADYVSLGYCPVRVPVMPIAARADFILEKLEQGEKPNVA